MSRVYVYALDKKMRLRRIDEAPNCHAFHVAIWQRLAVRNGLISATDHIMFSPVGSRSPRPELERLWKMISDLPRADSLILAATFDRCWFPVSMRTEVIEALEGAAGYASTAGDVAFILRSNKPDRGDRGFAFDSSLGGSWFCEIDDAGTHEVNHRGRKCIRCGVSDIVNAADIVAPRSR